MGGGIRVLLFVFLGRFGSFGGWWYLRDMAFWGRFWGWVFWSEVLEFMMREGGMEEAGKGV